MEPIIKVGRACYGISMIVTGVVQLIFADFRNVILPPWPSWRTNPEMAAYLVGAGLIVAGAAIIFTNKGRNIALVWGTILITIVVFWHLPYLLFIQPNKIRHLGLWAEASKALALAGGAFVVAGSFYPAAAVDTKHPVIGLMDKLIPFGRIFFSITMIEFGIDHFLYIDGISTLVPSWLPGSFFWTYLAGAALILSGLAIIFKFKLRLVATLQGAMILIWFFVLHIPRAISDPIIGNGNEVVSAGDALAFSGIAFIIAFSETKS